ncbi:hypothetical protein [Roseburia sp. 499]|nr:hypothetical protein [Roseburia sp. 499]WVK69011.1 hypothetical protein BIV20_11560 [Roseburia sp. 499]
MDEASSFEEIQEAFRILGGIAGWGYPIRTGGHCEYVVVNLVH